MMETTYGALPEGDALQGSRQQTGYPDYFFHVVFRQDRLPANIQGGCCNYKIRLEIFTEEHLVQKAFS